MVCREMNESTDHQSFRWPLTKWISNYIRHLLAVELNHSTHAFQCKIQRFWVFPKQIPIIRDFTSLPMSGFHPLLGMYLVKRATEKPREFISKLLFDMFHWHLLFMRNRISNHTISLKFGVFPLGRIGTLTQNQNKAKPIRKRVLTLSCTEDKTYCKGPILIQIICSLWFNQPPSVIWGFI